MKPEPLSFEARVQAERAILAVYHSHLIGSRRPFENVASRELVERRVRTYLKQSIALQRMWRTPVTQAMLEAEMSRISSNTRMPERLKEIYDALDRDPLLVLECFVRPILVNRLARSYFANDQRLHAETPQEWEGAVPTSAMVVASDGTNALSVRAENIDDLRDRETSRPKNSLGRSWDSWWEEVADWFDQSLVEVVGTPSAAGLPAPSCPDDDTWDNGSLTNLPVNQAFHKAVWTGTHMLSWGGSGFKYDPLTDTWSEMSKINAPSPRLRHTAVWTGSVMVVWGGDQGNPWLNSGGRYDPVGDTWSPTSLVDSPTARSSHTAIWTGREMIVWGGWSGFGTTFVTFNDGGRYDPVADRWSPISTFDAPEGRGAHTAVWTDSEMIVWGGWNRGSLYLATGGRYDTATDTWRRTSDIGSPSVRRWHSAVWTESQMIVWGGELGGGLADGGRYDPQSDTWTPMTGAGAPEGRYDHPAVWTGNLMIVWGGTGSGGGVTYDGGRYDPVTDTWTPTSPLNAPYPRQENTAVWTGTHMLVWGGCQYQCSGPVYAGGRYDPVADFWTPISPTNNAPTPVSGYSAVWTGNHMITWGGSEVGGWPSAAGWRYDPLTDDWAQIAMVGAPEGGGGHTAVWSGDEMLVWGGVPGFPYTEFPIVRGGRYDPLADTWRSISTMDAPEPRFLHTATWTGEDMVVWGGFNGTGDLRTGTILNSGGRYDPDLDAWRPVSMVGAPSARFPARAIWSGREMVIWGGDNGSGIGLGDGGRYDPVADTWRGISMVNAPSTRRNHASVWLGDRMMVWGGRFSGSSTQVDTGALYDPESDIWTPTSVVGAPSPRAFPHAVWTGDLAVIWGGSGNRTGGRYDPASDTWTPTSTDGAPYAAATAVWTGLHMIVWGDLRGGGRYVVFRQPDEDGDGVTSCGGDCDDLDASIHPGAVDLPGNRLDENCDGVPSCGPGSFYKTHGQFVRCVARECERLVAMGAVSRESCDELIANAARSSVARRQRSRGRSFPVEP